MIFESLDGGNGLRVHAPAKINLYLEILGQRPDGYHEIDTLMQAVSLYDTLEFRKRPASRNESGDSSDFIDFEVDGPPGLAAGPENLVARAARVLRDAVLSGTGAPASGSGVSSLTGLSIRLRKKIPVGGGLGGGSSDAAATLLALNRLWGLGWTRGALEPLAATLGSDVAFFLHGGWARCTGRGEKIEPLAPRPPLHFLLVTPDLHVPTALIYEKFRERRRSSPPRGPRSLKAGDSGGGGIDLTASQAVATMNFILFLKGLLEGADSDENGPASVVAENPYWLNRLQEVAFDAFPRLREVHEILAAEPFIKVQLTGSGATLFGVCADQAQAQALERKVKQRFEERQMACRVFRVQSVPSW
jgi:4-diphosphocytidyl-2-C-methyl-D-erythritol kinase